ncbi:hypothetical protein [Komagataeibacter sp. FNDCR2]|uniref:hypothetical protein n=1 Tax=Komagataeibacter sp. FNDCR2 TaxID=2878682 RepID=UPI001E4F971B|nr:hypothetical protein [Komagataeibacter sp. FNDCR2]MCE2576672.1 hypothetical protein [Komagataeibacter sp. FNDCR2]
MLRTPASNAQGSPGGPPPQPGVRSPDATGSEPPQGPAQMTTARGRVPQDEAQVARSVLSRRNIYIGAAVLVGGMGIGGFLAAHHGVSVPFVVQQGAPNASGTTLNPAPNQTASQTASISPPRFDTPNTPPVAGQAQLQASMPVPNTAPFPASIQVAPPMAPTVESGSIQTAQPPGMQPPSVSAASVAAGPVEPPASPADEHAAPAASSTQPTAEDRLLVEISHRMEELSDHVDTLEHKLDTTQQAFGEKLATGMGEFGGRLDELRHREDMLETQAREQATRAQPVPAPAPEPAVQANATPPVTPPAKAPQTPPQEKKPAHHESAHHDAPAAPAIALPHYTVQAAAPDIAILTGPEGNPIRVEPGADLGAWGKVVSVRQERNGWVVQTERGVIR